LRTIKPVARKKMRGRRNLPGTAGRMQPEISLRCCRKHKGSACIFTKSK
jgi:hypothetical protein